MRTYCTATQCSAAATANSLQLCPTLCDPIDGPCPWDSPGKNTRARCDFLLQCMKVKNESEVPQSCLTLIDPMDYSPPGPLSMGFSRQEYWSGVSLPSPTQCSMVTQMGRKCKKCFTLLYRRNQHNTVKQLYSSRN